MLVLRQAISLLIITKIDKQELCYLNKNHFLALCLVFKMLKMKNEMFEEKKEEEEKWNNQSNREADAHIDEKMI